MTTTTSTYPLDRAENALGSLDDIKSRAGAVEQLEGALAELRGGVFVTKSDLEALAAIEGELVLAVIRLYGLGAVLEPLEEAVSRLVDWQQEMQSRRER